MLKNERAQKQPRPVGRREAKKRAKLRRIEEAARALFRERGYHDTTTRAIAERAEIATGTLFTYFPEKRGLLLHLVRHEVDEAVERGFSAMSPVGDASHVVGALGELFDCIFEVYEGDPDLARVFTKELLFADGTHGTEAAAWTAIFMMRLAGELDAWRRRGVLRRDADCQVAAFSIFAQYYLCLIGWLGNPAITVELRDRLFRDSLEQLMRGLAPEGP